MIKKEYIVSTHGLPEDVVEDIKRLRDWQCSWERLEFFRWKKGDQHFFMGENFPGNIEEIPQAFPDEDEDGDWICAIEHLFPVLGAYLIENGITKCQIDFRF